MSSHEYKQSTPPFKRRHIGPSEEDVSQMLDTLGYPTRKDLVTTAVPDSILQLALLRLPVRVLRSGAESG